ncbi:unnamed protein product [Taenia asiatica]|uniref:Formate--tetrahydrofolate ligase n=1 Tax=Taenia asiatica TaxID=60517 RepID=A0A0R3VZC8_TAEAS|nr:unnamed protein product [Taenia asiatica]
MTLPHLIKHCHVNKPTTDRLIDTVGWIQDTKFVASCTLGTFEGKKGPASDSGCIVTVEKAMLATTPRHAEII